MDDDQRKCGGITLGAALLLAMCVAMIVVGALNIDFNQYDVANAANVVSTCTIEPRIPMALFVAGIAIILLLALRLIIQRACRGCVKGCDEGKLCTTMGFLGKFGCIAVYDLLALIAVVIWLIISTTWVMNVYNDVQYGSRNSGTYCPKYLYRFSFWTVIIGWIAVALLLLCGVLIRFCSCFWNLLCCKPCRQADANRTV